MSSQKLILLDSKHPSDENIYLKTKPNKKIAFDHQFEPIIQQDENDNELIEIKNKNKARVKSALIKRGSCIFEEENKEQEKWIKKEIENNENNFEQNVYAKNEYMDEDLLDYLSPKFKQ